MVNLTSPSWWVNQFVNTFITIMFIWILKKVFNKVDVPVISDIVSEA